MAYESQYDLDGDRQLNLFNAKRAVMVATDLVTNETKVFKSFQDGDMVTIQKTNKDIDPSEDPQGAPMIVEVNSSLGSMTINLQKGSTSCRWLSDIYNQKHALAIKFTSDEESVGSNVCFLTGMPDVSVGKSYPIRAWQITASNIVYNGNDVA